MSVPALQWPQIHVRSRSNEASRCVEQPLKIPFVAATILYANETKPEVASEAISRAGEQAQQALAEGNWRTFKLLLRLFACLQGMFEGDGVFPLLEELFNAAVDLQTASQEDVRPLHSSLAKLQLTCHTVSRSRTSQDYPLHPSLRHRCRKWRTRHEGDRIPEQHGHHRVCRTPDGRVG